MSLSCGKTEEKVVARVGDEVVTVGQMKDSYLAISPGARPVLMTIEEREQFARDVVSKEILVMEARKIGFDRMPEIVDMVQAEIRKHAWQAYYEDKVKSRVKVTEDELQELYAMQRYQYHLGWIFLRSGALANDISERIKRGEDFHELATMYSLDTSRERGGDLGVRALGTMPDDVEKKIMEMSPGEISEPIPYEGYAILVKVISKEPIEQQDFESSRTGLSSLAQMKAENKVHRELAKQVRAKYNLVFNDDVLDLIASTTAALYASGTASPGQVPDFSDEELARVVATYEGGEWRVRTYVEKLRAQRGMISPGAGTDAETVRSLIQDFIGGELWFVEITNEGYDRLPEVTRAVERTQEEMTVTAMHGHVIRDVAVDDEKLREFYEENRAEMVTEPGATLGIIFVESEAIANEAYEELRSGRRFGDVAKEKSIDQVTAERGGELPRPMYKRQLEQFPEVDEIVDTLSEGSYSRPLPVPPGFGPDGYMIVKAIKKIEIREMEFAEVKDMLGERVLQMEQERAFGEWLTQMMLDYNVEIYPDALGEIDFEELREQES
jgi:parvulin-like peptidyl-prolyl isomerase